MEILKRIILSCIILYTYNLLAINVNMMIPINVISILIVTLLGVPGFILIVLFKAFML